MDTETPAVEPGKKSKTSSLTIALIILLVVALGLGTGGFILNSNLKSARTTHASLQKNHEALTSDTTKLTSDLEKAKTDLKKANEDLEKARKDLTTAQENLAKSGDTITRHRENIAKALLYLDVASALFIDKAELTALTAKVVAVKDPQLEEKFSAYTSGGSTDDFNAWLAYLFGTIADLLK